MSGRLTHRRLTAVVVAGLVLAGACGSRDDREALPPFR
jgi:hypothetical protein